MSVPDRKTRDHVEIMQAHVRTQVRSLCGLDDTSGVELFSLMRMLMNLCAAIEAKTSGEDELSGPRWGLLLRLMAEEQRGNQAGITPTSLSHYQSVSKNTISALLRGLEEQGLIQRALDAEDYRVRRIQLTDAGRELVKTTAPKRMRHLNEMVSGLSGPECEQLIALLAKLFRSLMATSNISRTELRGG